MSLPNCKTYVEGKGWLYKWEIATHEAKLAPTRPLDELFNEKWGKIPVVAEMNRLGREKPLKHYTMTWQEIRDDNWKS